MAEGAAGAEGGGADRQWPHDATEATLAAQAEVAATMPEDDSDFARVERGLLARADSLTITDAGGKIVWGMEEYSFEASDAPAPPTVNPSLWRQARLNTAHGLFEVCDGVYQVRGYDLANVSFVRGATGWLVIDPLMSTETARAALDLIDETLGERPVVGVIYTHSHVDHFAGVLGVTSPEEVASGRVQVIAPAGFMTEVASENVIAGNVMVRRATYMYGGTLPRGPRGHVDSGLGKAGSTGGKGLIAPTHEVHATGEKLEIDGIEIEFQLTPGTEAPAEMNFFFPQFGALCMAENCSAHLHNVLTPRGAQVRDALGWSKYMAEAMDLWVERTEVLFASHHWPRWGTEIPDFLAKQRDLYRYLHDQTMRLANHGLTPIEIAEEIQLPGELACEYFCRDYYGTLNHNAKAVYQRYIGWFDGNPANLHPLPPVEAGRRYVEYMGGADALLERARRSFGEGDYRWVAEVVNHLVFAEPDNQAARELQADTLEQLGYQAESAPWRDFYLTGAQELRHGVPSRPGPHTGGAGYVGSMTVDMMFDYLAVRLNGPRAQGRRLTINWVIEGVAGAPDGRDRWVLGLENAALHYHHGDLVEDADATVTLARRVLEAVWTGRTTIDDAVASGRVVVEGRAAALTELFELFDRFDFWFPIVTP
ncbi:MAG TPA: MBL fold metallo-hydrolase [Acidimicrobiales bacterium]|nr:MBL fold metallo-hydrolase [Acidimicrobiales bacterium]